MTKVNKSYKAIVEDLLDKYLSDEITIEEYTKSLQDLKRVNRTLEGTSPAADKKLLLG